MQAKQYDRGDKIRHGTSKSSLPISDSMPKAVAWATRTKHASQSGGLERIAVAADVLGHALDEGEDRVGCREWCHVFAAVARKAEVVEAWDDEALGGGDEAKEADHREPAVVHLSIERLRLALCRQALGETEGIPQVERHWVRVTALEARVVAGLAATHVVLLAVTLEGEGVLAMHLEEAHDQDNLEFGGRRERV